MNSKIIYEDLLIDRNAAPEEVFCIICLNLIRDARSCNQGHLYCDVCIKQWLETKTTCPSCRCLISYSNLSKNRLVNNLIGNLKIKCPNSCCEIFQINQIENHLNQCQKRLIKCHYGCSSDLIRYDSLSNHLEICQYNFKNHCPYKNDRKIEKFEIIQNKMITQEQEQEQEKEQEQEQEQYNNINNNNNLYNFDIININYLNYLQMKINQLELNNQKLQERFIIEKLKDDEPHTHKFDWVIENFNEKIRNLSENGYFEIIPIESISIKFYPHKVTTYKAHPCSPIINLINIWQISINTQILVPIDLNLIIKYPKDKKQIETIIKKDYSLDIQLDRIDNIKSDLTFSFEMIVKKKNITLFKS